MEENKKLLTAQEVYQSLINDDKILTLNGQIQFDFGDVGIIVKQRDVVGNIMQEWVQGWLDARNVAYDISESTQMPPDFYLNPDDKTRDLLEIKAFYRKNNPGFDIADFTMYSNELIAKPYVLDTDYLVFGYDMSKDGIVTVKDLWIKKVWQITRPMKKYPVNLQVKKDVVHKIRPGKWYGTLKKGSYPMFSSKEDFLSAIEETVYKNPATHDSAGTWKSRFCSAYKKHYGYDIDFDRWNDVMDKYTPVEETIKLD